MPGPWYARLTALVYHFRSAVQQQQAQYVHSLHQRYGPVVRIAPNHVSIASLDGHAAVHRIGSGFTKDPQFYHFLGPSDDSNAPHGLFQMTDVKSHSIRRRLFSQGFSVASLRQEWEPMLVAKVRAAIEGIRAEARCNATAENEHWGAVDMRKWWMLFASDVVSHMVFGKSFDGLRRGKVDTYFASIRRVNEAATLHSLFPWIYRVARRIPLPILRRFFDHVKVVSRRGELAVANSRESTEQKNIFGNILAQADNEQGTLSDADIIYEAGAIMIAGSDTTSQTLTYLIWRILLDPVLRKALEEEAKTIHGSVTDAKLEVLPLLKAVVWETMRLYSAVPGPWPRVVPRGGLNIHGYDIPAGTIVSTQAWTIHRDAEVFEDPLRFDYKRWLPNGSAATSAKARASWVPFGGGTRNCIGRYLAEMELRHAAFAFVRDCKDACLAPETTLESMEVVHFISIHPKSGTCRIMFPSEVNGNQESGKPETSAELHAVG
ncbi:hypothetical protein BST61_g9285 [Cercospora zeina]